MEQYTLTKEDFWDKLEAKYPAEMKAFNEWIDVYKNSVHWDMLFCNQTYIKPQSAFVKFHSIPTAMQYGIFLHYIHQTGKAEISFEDVVTAIIEDFFEMEHDLKPQQWTETQ